MTSPCPSSGPLTLDDMGMHEMKPPVATAEGVRLECRRCGATFAIPNAPEPVPRAFAVERIIPAEELSLFPSAVEFNGEEMLGELMTALREKPLPDGAYRIRISIEPEGR